MIILSPAYTQRFDFEDVTKCSVQSCRRTVERDTVSGPKLRVSSSMKQM